MKAIVISYKRFLELKEKLLDKIALTKDLEISKVKRAIHYHTCVIFDEIEKEDK